MTKVLDEELFPDAERERRERLAVTSHALRERFGTAGLTRGSLIGDPSGKRDSQT